MKKIWLIIFGFILILFIGIMIVVISCMDNFIKTKIETKLSELTKVPVSIENLKISIFSGKGEIKNFVLCNPEGFNTDFAVKAKDILLDIDVKSLLSDNVIIEKISITAPEITYEGGLDASNISQIMQNIKDSAKANPSNGNEHENINAENENEKKFKINNFEITNAKVNLKAKALKSMTLSINLPNIHLENIGSDSEGLSAANILNDVFEVIGGKVSHVSKEELKQFVEKSIKTVIDMGKQIEKKAKKRIEDFLKDFKK
jgi:uncharacterized protein involved in outer membrane biogenesis